MIQFPDLNDTIVAISTAPGEAAIAMVRMSGPASFSIISQITNVVLDKKVSHKQTFCRIMDGEDLLDEVLVGQFIAPKTYTRQDMIEISCHGSSYIQQRLVEIILEKGARMAKPGEFTMRAFLNGSMDLAQAEAVSDLISSHSAGSHRMAMNQMRGGFTAEIAELRQKLIDFASLIELELDFSEEDVEFVSRVELKELLEKIRSHIHSLRQSFKLGNAIKNGISTVIAGRPNAGKSTLLNVLLNEERAIVSDIPGTTRDTLEENINIEGNLFRLIDTAGIRDAQDQIEAMGVERTMKKVAESSILMYVFDASRQSAEEVATDLAQLNFDKESLLVVANKMDRNPYLKSEDYQNDHSHPSHFITCSAKNNMNILYLKEKLLEISGLQDLPQHAIISNLRHMDALGKADEHLETALNNLESGITTDFVAMDIRQALHYLGEITGHISTEDLLGNIFGRFCIGK